MKARKQLLLLLDLAHRSLLLVDDRIYESNRIAI